MAWADPNYHFSAIAVTKNFVGSPHIDKYDITYQHAISLGEFKTGGQLCVESEDHNRVSVVGTHGRLVRVDGRFVHWVRRFGGGDRFSLIFYATVGTGATEKSRAVHAGAIPATAFVAAA
jgi:hypothetical protein